MMFMTRFNLSTGTYPNTKYRTVCFSFDIHSKLASETIERWSFNKHTFGGKIREDCSPYRESVTYSISFNPWRLGFYCSYEVETQKEISATEKMQTA